MLKCRYVKFHEFIKSLSVHGAMIIYWAPWLYCDMLIVSWCDMRQLVYPCSGLEAVMASNASICTVPCSEPSRHPISNLKSVLRSWKCLCFDSVVVIYLLNYYMHAFCMFVCCASLRHILFYCASGEVPWSVKLFLIVFSVVCDFCIMFSLAYILS